MTRFVTISDVTAEQDGEGVIFGDGTIACRLDSGTSINAVSLEAFELAQAGSRTVRVDWEPA